MSHHRALKHLNTICHTLCIACIIAGTAFSWVLI